MDAWVAAGAGVGATGVAPVVVGGAAPDGVADDVVVALLHAVAKRTVPVTALIARNARRVTMLGYAGFNPLMGFLL